MELAVGVLIRLLDALYALHDVQGGDQVTVQLGGIAHQTQNGVGMADALMDDDVFFLQPCLQTFQLGLVGIMLQDDDHK